jgi:hypothetical protein
MKRTTQLLGFRAAWRKAKANQTDESLSRGGWRLGWGRTRLQAVLDQVSAATGLVTEVTATVDPRIKVKWDSQTVTPANALARLAQALNRKHCLTVQRGRKLMVIRAQDAKKHTVPLPLLKPKPAATRTGLLARILSTDVTELVRMLACGAGEFGRPRTSA